MSTDHDTRQEHRRGHIVTRDKTTPLHPPLTASVTASLKSLHPTVDDIDRAPRSAIRPKISSEGDVSPGHASTSQATLAPPDFDSEAEERSSENVCKTNQPLHFRLDLRLCSIVDQTVLVRTTSAFLLRYFTVWSGTRSAGWDEAWPLVSGPRRSTLIFSVYSWFATSNPELSFGTDYLCVIYSRCKSNSFVDGVGWVWMHHYSTSTLISQSIRILYHEWNRQNVPRGGAVQDTETVDTRLSLRLAPLDPRSLTARMYQT
jgi:hypothetical protein